MHFRRPQHARRAGFTLMELLIVVSLIMLLAVLLLPALETAGAQARAARCLSNLNQVFKAMKLYSVTYDSWYPSPAYADTQPDTTGSPNPVDDPTYFWGHRDPSTPITDGNIKVYHYKSHTWRGKIVPFVGFNAPAVSQATKDKYGPVYYELEDELTRQGGAYDVFRCTVVYGAPPYTSYVRQYFGLNGFVAIYTNPQRLRKTPGGDIAASHPDVILNSAQTIAIGENWDSHWVLKPKEPPAGYFEKITVEGKQIYAGEVIARHRRRSNYVFYDGHGEAMEPQKADAKDCYLWRPDKE